VALDTLLTKLCAVAGAIVSKAIADIGPDLARATRERICAIAKITCGVSGGAGVNLHVHLRDNQVGIYTLRVVTIKVCPPFPRRICTFKGQEELTQVEVEVPKRVPRVHIDRHGTHLGRIKMICRQALCMRWVNLCSRGTNKHSGEESKGRES